MGNCLRLRRRESSSMVWAGDDWDFSVATNEHIPEKHGLLEDDDHHNGTFSSSAISETTLSSSSSSSSSSSTTTTSLSSSVINKEIKIKITKKKLEKLLGEVDDMHEMPVDQLLSRLINASDHHEELIQQQHSWRPSLQSIPEID